MNVWKKLKLNITIGRWEMDLVNKKLENFLQIHKLNKYLLRRDIVKLIKRIMKDNITQEVVLINK